VAEEMQPWLGVVLLLLWWRLLLLPARMQLHFDCTQLHLQPPLKPRQKPPQLQR
jgi:hypothetical protein